MRKQKIDSRFGDLPDAAFDPGVAMDPGAQHFIVAAK
jgi:hypothetical protein